MDVYPLLSNVLYLHKYRLQAADTHPLMFLAFSLEGKERENLAVSPALHNNAKRVVCGTAVVVGAGGWGPHQHIGAYETVVSLLFSEK